MYLPLVTVNSSLFSSVIYYPFYVFKSGTFAFWSDGSSQRRKRQTEKAFEMGWKPDMSYRTWTNKKVAIIGSGVAGLTLANFLYKIGLLNP